CDPVFADLLHLPTAESNDQPTNTRVPHEHIGSTAEHCDRNAGCIRKPERGKNFLFAVRLNQPVRRTSDPKRREGAEWNITSDAVWAEGRSKRLPEFVHNASRGSRAISARSCAISAAIASRGEHTANEILSPGAN